MLNMKDQYFYLSPRQTLPTEFVGKRPMCMMQKLSFFGGSRIPKHDIDEFDNQTLEDDISTTLLISHNNQVVILALSYIN